MRLLASFPGWKTTAMGILMVVLSPLIEGVNLLGVQVPNTGQSSRDLVFDARPAGEGADRQSPHLVAIHPEPGSVVGAIPRITLFFDEPVTGAFADDLIVNGVAAVDVESVGDSLFFTLDPVESGRVGTVVSTHHGITDLSGNPWVTPPEFLSWAYTLLDVESPKVVGMEPAANSTLGKLDQIEIRFSEEVSGVDADDLVIEGKPARSVESKGFGVYVFSFDLNDLDGPIEVSWTGSHGIRDLSPEQGSFAGGEWRYFMDPTLDFSTIVISEILASNRTGLRDQDGDAVDWIEIGNHGTDPIDLGGWSLSNDPDVARQWVFPSLILEPGGLAIVFASGKDRSQSELHANFKLGMDGEFLGLYSAADPFSPVHGFVPRYPPQRTDIAYGLDASGESVYFTTPTPGRPNSQGRVYSGIAEGPSASLSSGFHQAPIEVALTSGEDGAEIYYTLDGTEPVPTLSTLYRRPLNLSGSPDRPGVVLRAIAARPDHLSSDETVGSYIFSNAVLEQSDRQTGLPSVWGSSPPTSSDYEMDQRVFADDSLRSEAAAALVQIPAISVVMDPGDFLGVQKGIYFNPEQSGLSWERPAILDWISGSELESFSISCGIRIQGGSSVNNWKSKKLSMRLSFKRDFGPATLPYRLFGGHSAKDSDKLILDAHLNLVFTHPSHGQRVKSQYVRDLVMSDWQWAMGHPSPHGRFVNLFVNGVYWGMYELHEEPDESFAAAYWGGRKEDWDIFKHSGNRVESGNNQGWMKMMGLLSRDLNQPDVFRELSALLDLDGFMDYMLLNFYAGNTDWPHHNWYAAYNRQTGGPLRFVTWDAEHVLKGVNDNRLGVNDGNTPGGVFQSLRQSSEFRFRFRDRIYKHFVEPQGVFYTDPNQPSWDAAHPERNQPARRYMERIKEIEAAVLLESARWGDVYRPEQPYTREGEWRSELNWLLREYFPERTRVVLDQFVGAGLYGGQPDPPQIEMHPDSNLGGMRLMMQSNRGGVVYFTLNGVDPRLPFSGSAHRSALTYQEPVTIRSDSLLSARVLLNGQWSPLVERFLHVPGTHGGLQLSEVMYHPLGGNGYEFIEWFNAGNFPLDLSGYRLWDPDFLFHHGARIEPGQTLVLAGNVSAFSSRHPGVIPEGEFDANLGNGGDGILLSDRDGNPVFHFTYDDSEPWPESADGLGPSLERWDFHIPSSLPSAWVAAGAGGQGSPGRIIEKPESSVWISEIMADNQSAVDIEGRHPDWMELHNSGGGGVSIGGWSVTDNTDPRRYVFPPGLILPAGSFLPVWFSEQWTETGLHTGFGLNREGETIRLYNAEGEIVDALTYGRIATDTSLMRLARTGDWMAGTPTPGMENRTLEAGDWADLVINEWKLESIEGNSSPWVEVFNNNPGKPLLLNRLVCSYSNLEFRLESPSVLGSRDFMVLELSPNPWLDTGLQFSFDPDLVIAGMDGRTWDRIESPASSPGASAGRLPDGDGPVVVLATATPGRPNLLSVQESDSDGDGMPDEWELEFGLDPTDATDALQDSDRDGYSNLEEYRTGHDPSDGESRLGIRGIRLVDGDAHIQYWVPAGRRLVLEYRDLSTSIWVPVKENEVADRGFFMTVTDADIQNPGKFYRVRTK